MTGVSSSAVSIQQPFEVGLRLPFEKFPFDGLRPVSLLLLVRRHAVHVIVGADDVRRQEDQQIGLVASSRAVCLKSPPRSGRLLRKGTRVSASLLVS